MLGCCNYHESWFENKHNARKKMNLRQRNEISEEKTVKFFDPVIGFNERC